MDLNEINSLLNDNDSIDGSNSSLSRRNEKSSDYYKIKNQKLKEEMNTLKNQFDEAIKLNSSIKNIQSENQELKRENQEKTNKIEESEKRMEILYKNFTDLKKKFEEVNLIHSNEISTLSQNYEIEIKATIDRFNEVDSIKNDLENSNKNMKEEISSFLKSASDKLKRNFMSLNDVQNYISTIGNDLRDHYENTFVVNQLNDQNSSNDINPNEIGQEKLIESMKYLKKKNHKYKNQIKGFKDEYLNLQNDHDEQKDKYEQKLNDLQRALNEERQQNLKSSQKIAELEANNARLQNDLKKANDQIPKIKETVASSFQQESSIKDDEIESLQKQLSNLQQQQQKLTSKKSKLHKKLEKVTQIASEFAKENDELKHEIIQFKQKNAILLQNNTNTTQENNKLKDELNKSKQNNDQLQKEIKDLLQKHTEYKNHIAKYKQELQDLRVDFSKSKIESKNQKQEISSLLNAKKESDLMIQKLQAEVKSNEDKYIEENNKNKNLQFQLDAIRDQPSFDNVPDSVWFSNLLPKDLASEIKSIGINKSLLLSDRITQALDKVGSYIRLQIPTTTQANSNNFIVSSKLAPNEGVIPSVTRTLNNLLYIINNQIGEPKIPFDDLNSFLNRNKNNEVTQQISNRFNEIADQRAKLDDENEKKHQILNKVANALGIKIIDNAENEILDILKKVEEQQEQIKQITSEKKSVKSAYHKLMRQYDTIGKKIKREISIKDSEINRLQDENAKKESDYNMSLSKIDELQSEIQKINEEKDEYISNFEIEQQNQTTRLCESIENNFQRQMKKKEAELANEKEKNQNCLQQIEKVKKQNSQMKNKITELTQELKAYDKQFEEVKKQTFEQAKTDSMIKISKIRDDLETAKAIIQDKDKEIQQYSDQLNKLKDSYKIINDAKRKLERDMKIAQSRIETSRQELEREKHITEMKISNITTSAQLKHSSDIDELKSNFENQKRQIYLFVADQFRQFYDPREQINDDSFKDIIKSVKDKIESLYNTQNLRSPLYTNGSFYSNSTLDLRKDHEQSYASTPKAPAKFSFPNNEAYSSPLNFYLK